MSIPYYLPDSMMPSTVVEAQPFPYNADCHDVSLMMLKPPSGLEDPIQYHKTAVHYVLQCYGALMCKEDHALLEKVVGSRPTAQQTTEPHAHRGNANDLCGPPTNADVAVNGASFRPYSPFRFSWDKGKGRADTTQHRNETYLKSLSPYIGMSAVSDTFQDTTNKTTNLQLSPMTEKASTENVECPIKQEDEPYIADLTSAEEPVSPSPVGRLAAHGYNRPNASTEDNNAVEPPKSEHAPDNPSKLPPNETNQSAIKRKREEETEGLVESGTLGPIRSLRARKMPTPAVVDKDSTPNQVKKIPSEGNVVEVVSSTSTGDTGIAPAPPKPIRPVRKMTARMRTGGKPPKRPSPDPPSPPPRPRKKTARMTTGGKPPKRATIRAPPPPPTKRQRRALE